MKTAFGLGCAVLLLSVFSATADDPFSGTWTITDARTLGGEPYSGTVRIASIGAVYELEWNTTVGKYRGLGLAEGNKLCTAWGKNFGVVLYQINGDGTLSGRWTIAGANAEGKEEARGGAPNELEGEYSIKGSNPGGKGGYEGKLRIRKTGATYQLRWTVPGSQPYFGIGLRVGDSLHVGWGSGKDSYAVISYTFDGASAEGLWTIGGSDKTAKELLTKK